MSFTPNIPTTGQTLGQTKFAIQDNFTTLRNSLAIDHIDVNLAEQGKHKFIHLRLIGSAGNPTPPITDASEGAFFHQDALGRGVVFWKTVSNTNTIQMTGVPPIVSASGSTFLPGANGSGGLLLQWGSFDPNVSTTVIFPVPFAIAPYNIQLTGSASNNSTFRANVSTGSVTNLQFVFEGTISSAWNPIYWMAIGVAP